MQQPPPLPSSTIPAASRIYNWCRGLRWLVFLVVFGLIGVGAGMVASRRHHSVTTAEKLEMLAVIDKYNQIELTAGAARRVLAIDVSRCPPEFRAAHVELIQAAMAYEDALPSDGIPEAAFRRVGIAMHKSIGIAKAE